jgi:hypothetical protein
MRPRERSLVKRLGARQLTALVEEAIMDAYGDSETTRGIPHDAGGEARLPVYDSDPREPRPCRTRRISTMPKRSWRSVAADVSDS